MADKNTLAQYRRIQKNKKKPSRRRKFRPGLTKTFKEGTLRRRRKL